MQGPGRESPPSLLPYSPGLRVETCAVLQRMEGRDRRQPAEDKFPLSLGGHSPWDSRERLSVLLPISAPGCIALLEGGHKVHSPHPWLLDLVGRTLGGWGWGGDRALGSCHVRPGSQPAADGSPASLEAHTNALQLPSPPARPEALGQRQQSHRGTCGGPGPDSCERMRITIELGVQQKLPQLAGAGVGLGAARREPSLGALSLPSSSCSLS